MSDATFASWMSRSAQTVVELLRDSLTGYAEMTRDLYQRSRDPATSVDPVKEVSRWCERTVRDGARLFVVLDAIFDDLASSPTTPTPPSSDPSPASNCIKITVGPVPTGGAAPADLRRRGETMPTIPASKVTVTRNPANSTLVDVEVEAGGYSRGLYEGSVAVAGATVASYNIYVDW